MWEGLESRKFPRVETNCLILIERMDVTLRKRITTKTQNIGIGGICVVLEEALPKFSKIRIQLDLGDGVRPIVCDARVVWMVESRDLTTEKITHDTGIEFLNLSRNSEDRIKHIIKAKLPTSN